MDITKDLAEIDILLAGFPKCGTTSLSFWMSTDTNFEVSVPKETFCLCSEFGALRERAAVTDLKECFKKQNKEKGKIKVEATSLNIYSTSLLNSLKESGHVRIILMYRDHSQAVKSWHSQMLFAGLTSVTDLEKSWKKSLRPDNEQDNFLTNYSSMFEMGKWVELWVQELGHERVLLIKTEDLGKKNYMRACLSKYCSRVFSENMSFTNSNSKFTGNYKIASLFQKPKARKIYNKLEKNGFPMQQTKQGLRRLLSFFTYSDGVLHSDNSLTVLKEIKEYYVKDKELLEKIQFENSLIHSQK